MLSFDEITRVRVHVDDRCFCKHVLLQLIGFQDSMKETCNEDR